MRADKIEKGEEKIAKGTESPISEICEPSKSEQEIEVKSKRGRLIMRNIPFAWKSGNIKGLLKGIGELEEINVAEHPIEKRNKGYAFVQFRTKQQALNAIQQMNGKKIRGRPIALDLAVPKFQYKEIETRNKYLEEQKMFEGEGEEKEMEDIQDTQNIIQKTQKTKNTPQNIPQINTPQNITTELEENVEVTKKNKNKRDNRGESKATATKPERRKMTKDEEESTVFIRNLGFEITESDLHEYMSAYGELNYAKLVINKDTGVHRGTAFVQFKNSQHAQTLLQLSNQIETYYQNKAKGKTATCECIYILN